MPSIIVEYNSAQFKDIYQVLRGWFLYHGNGNSFELAAKLTNRCVMRVADENTLDEEVLKSVSPLNLTVNSVSVTVQFGSLLTDTANLNDAPVTDEYHRFSIVYDKVNLVHLLWVDTIPDSDVIVFSDTPPANCDLVTHLWYGKVAAGASVVEPYEYQE